MSKTIGNQEKSIYHHMLRGSAWALLMRWSIRGIGLVSTVILARLLTPEDFGIMAMASISIGLLNSFSELGAGIYLIREPNVGRAHCDTAWTLVLLQNITIGIIFFLLAHPAAEYFSEPRLVLVMYWIAVSSIIIGTTNIGMVLVRKELDFAKDFRFGVYQRILAFCSTVTLAFLLNNYWALVFGQVLSSLFGVLLSYRMHPYRPNLSLEKAREFLIFSFSIIPISVAKYLRESFDVIVVGRLGSTSALGGYHVAAELASMATQEIVLPVGRALFPSYAKLVGDRNRLAEVYLQILSAVVIISIPVGFGLSGLAHDFINVILGKQWIAAVPFLQWLAIYGLLKSLSRFLIGNILVVAGHEKRSAIAEWIYLVVLMPAVLVGGMGWGIDGVVRAATVAAFLTLPIMVLILIRTLPISLKGLVNTIWPPVFSGLVMLSGLHFLGVKDLNILLVQLLLNVAIGAVFYVCSLVILWRLRGAPEGIERDTLTFLRNRVYSCIFLKNKPKTRG